MERNEHTITYQHSIYALLVQDLTHFCTINVQSVEWSYKQHRVRFLKEKINTIHSRMTYVLGRYLFGFVWKVLPHLHHDPPPPSQQVPPGPGEVEAHPNLGHAVVQMLLHGPVLLARSLDVAERVKIRKYIHTGSSHPLKQTRGE